MITIDEAYNIIVGLNEEAHECSWDTWIEADELDNSSDEEDWSEADYKREEASKEQAGHFREGFNELDEETKKAILHYVNTNESFKEEFVVWYGEDEFASDFN